MKARLIAIALCGLFLFFIAAPLAIQPYVWASTLVAEPDSTVTSVQETPSCQAILTRAMDTLKDVCSDLGRNKACYGHDTVRAELRSTDVRFSTLGDIVPIQMIKKITTSALDLQRGTWGLSLLKLQANLPDTLPGQNVTFLVYGDMSIDNLSGNMQSFYFTSGLGDLKCSETPDSGILIKSPNHTQVTFTANGVQITMASTVLLRAAKGRAMDVQLIEGHASVRTKSGASALTTGQQVSISLGGSSGLEAQGKPSAPKAAPANPALAPVIRSAENISQGNSPSGLPTATTGKAATQNAAPDVATVAPTVANAPIPETPTMTTAPVEATATQVPIVIPTNTTEPQLPSAVPPTLPPPAPTEVPAATAVPPTAAENPPGNNPQPTVQSASSSEPPTAVSMPPGQALPGDQPTPVALPTVAQNVGPLPTPVS